MAYPSIHRKNVYNNRIIVTRTLFSRKTITDIDIRLIWRFKGKNDYLHGKTVTKVARNRKLVTELKL